MKVNNTGPDQNLIPFRPSSGKDNNSFADHLQAALNNKDEKKLLSACRDMEAVFLGTVFQTIRNTIPRNNYLNQGFADDVWQSMLYDEFAKEMSRTQATGIAQMLFKQLGTKI